MTILSLLESRQHLPDLGPADAYFIEIGLEFRTSLTLLLILFEWIPFEGVFWSVQFDLERFLFFPTS